MTPYAFSEKDIQQITDLGQTVEKVHAQLALFHQGTPFVKLDRPCTPGDGIIRLSDHQMEEAAECFETEARSKELIKFRPRLRSRHPDVQKTDSSLRGPGGGQKKIPLRRPFPH